MWVGGGGMCVGKIPCLIPSKSRYISPFIQTKLVSWCPLVRILKTAHESTLGTIFNIHTRGVHLMLSLGSTGRVINPIQISFTSSK